MNRGSRRPPPRRYERCSTQISHRQQVWHHQAAIHVHSFLHVFLRTAAWATNQSSLFGSRFARSWRMSLCWELPPPNQNCPRRRQVLGSCERSVVWLQVAWTICATAMKSYFYFTACPLAKTTVYFELFQIEYWYNRVVHFDLLWNKGQHEHVCLR